MKGSIFSRNRPKPPGMRLWGLLALVLSCATAPTGPEIAQPWVEKPSAESKPLPPEKEAPIADPPEFSRYRLTSDPPGAGVFRELGDMAGITPLDIDFSARRAYKLTFLKKGFRISSIYLTPEKGIHELHVVLEKEN